MIYDRRDGVSSSSLTSRQRRRDAAPALALWRSLISGSEWTAHPCLATNKLAKNRFSNGSQISFKKNRKQTNTSNKKQTHDGIYDGMHPSHNYPHKHTCIHTYHWCLSGVFYRSMPHHGLAPTFFYSKSSHVQISVGECFCYPVLNLVIRSVALVEKLLLRIYTRRGNIVQSCGVIELQNLDKHT